MSYTATSSRMWWGVGVPSLAMFRNKERDVCVTVDLMSYRVLGTYLLYLCPRKGRGGTATPQRCLTTGAKTTREETSNIIEGEVQRTYVIREPLGQDPGSRGP
jgi:hypothetical protein